MPSPFFPMKNKYLYHAHISESDFRLIMRYFALDIEIIKIAILTGISRQSLNKIIFAVRQRLAWQCEEENPLRMRSGNEEMIAFGILKHDDRICTQGFGLSAMDDLIALRHKWRVPERFHPYAGVIDVGSWKYYQISPELGEVQAFWGLTKERLAKFRGLHRSMIYYHLKESEYRYNHRHESIYPLLLDLCRHPPLRLT